MRTGRYSPIELLTLAALTTIGAAGAEIRTIEFFGHKGINIEQLRGVLPVREGDAYSDGTKDLIRRSVASALGSEPTDVAAICCDEKGNYLIFVGVPGESVRSFRYRAAPEGSERLPVSLMDLYRRLDRAIEEAVRKGGDAAQEEKSQGYALLKDPPARSLQVKVREWALGHEAELLRVLEFSSAEDHRRVASDALGYARPSGRQIAALVQASRDPDQEVRNNAVRALGVLVRSNKGLADEIDPQTFIEMLNSGTWTDRNKSAGLLHQLSVNRDTDLLGRISGAALESLIEMARWRQASHAFFCRVILGRIAGIPEKELSEMAWKGDVEAIIEAARGR